MTFTVLLPTDASATALAFDSEHDTLEEAIAACGDILGAMVEVPAFPCGVSIAYSVPLSPQAAEAAQVAAAEALLPESYEVVPVAVAVVQETPGALPPEALPLPAAKAPEGQALNSEASEGQTPEGQTPEGQTPAKRRRARREDGTFKADDPATPDVDEAFEP